MTIDKNTQLADLAAQWGGDPVYDAPPNEKGDGYLFYNFRENQHDPAWLRDKFIPALTRTVEKVRGNPGSYDADALPGLVLLCGECLARSVLDTFTLAYIRTALWSTNDESDERGGVPLDDNYTVNDLHAHTLGRMALDCSKFQRDNAQTIADAVATGQVKCGPDFDESWRAGHDFWLTRNGHGCGFWDGDWPEPYATALTKAAKAFGECGLYVGGDGKLYLL